MSKVDSKTRKERWSSDKVVVLRKKPKPKPKIAASVKPNEVVKTQKKKPAPAKKPVKKMVPQAIIDEFYDLIDATLPKKFPYEIGIEKRVYAILREKVEDGNHLRMRKALKIVISGRVHSVPYQMAMKKEPYRYGLEGETYEIDPEHRDIAKKWLRRYFKKKKKEKKRELKKSA